MGQRQLTAGDGFNLGAYEALPQGSPKAGIVVIQEIFGVNTHIREVADGYAAAGYAAIAPQIFDRAERNVELGYTDQAEFDKGLKLAFRRPQNGKHLARISRPQSMPRLTMGRSV